MKRLALVVLGWAVVFNSANATDMIARLGAGGLELSKTDNIQIASEKLTLSTSKVRVVYQFKNISDKDISTTVSFPMPAFDGRKRAISTYKANEKAIDSFAISVNGKSVSTTQKNTLLISNIDVTDKLRNIGLSDSQIFDPYMSCFANVNIENYKAPESCNLNEQQNQNLHALDSSGNPWKIQQSFYWEQTFPAGQEVEITLEYAPLIGYDWYNILKDGCPNEGADQAVSRLENKYIKEHVFSSRYNNEVEFNFGKPSDSRSTIKDFNLIIKKDFPEQIISLCFPGKSKKTSPTTIEFHQENYLPQDKILVYFVSVLKQKTIPHQPKQDQQSGTKTSKKSDLKSIVQIVIDSQSIPTFLDSDGQVWSTHKPTDNNDIALYQLPNLEHVKQIKPFMALDDNGHVFTWEVDAKQVDSGPGGLENTGTTEPKIVKELKDVSIINSSGQSFVAVKNNGDIYVWGAKEYIHKLYSRPGIKSVAYRFFPEHPEYSGSLIPEARSLLMLMDNGDLIGLGIKDSGAPTRATFLKEILLAKYPGAMDIALNATHSVLLASDGTVHFWGGCDIYGKNANREDWTSNTVEDVPGFINDVASMSIDEGNDNAQADVFITKGGTVWVAFAPMPEGMHGFDCYRGMGGTQQFWQLKAGNSKAVQAVTRNGQIIMLDENGQVWASGGWMNTQFYKVPLIAN